MIQGEAWNIPGPSSRSLRALNERAASLATKSRASSTKIKYWSHFVKFQRWGSSMDPPLPTLPASSHTVVLFLTDLADKGASRAMLYGYFYGIRWVHELNGHPDPTSAPLTRLVLEGAKRNVQKIAVSKDSCSIGVLKSIITAASNDRSLRFSRFCTMAVLAFAAFLRIGELIKLRRCDITLHTDYIELFIPRSKRDVYADGATVMVSKGHSETCPVDTLCRYLLRVDLLEPQENTSFIFRNLSPKNRNRLVEHNKPMLYGRAREDLLFYAKRLKLSNNLAWHSFRRGGATAAANNGVPDRLLKKHGRWASDGAKNRYVDEDLRSKLIVSSKLGL